MVLVVKCAEITERLYVLAVGRCFAPQGGHCKGVSTSFVRDDRGIGGKVPGTKNGSRFSSFLGKS